MTPNREMTIPKSRADVVFSYVIATVAIVFTGLAVINLFQGVALVASGIWLAFILLLLRSTIKDQGGVRAFLKNWLGDLVGRRFVECTRVPHAVRFGFDFLGHRFIQQVISADRIKSAYWSTGQGTAMVGRDVGDWQIFLGFDHSNPAKRAQLELCTVSPAAEKSRTAALGKSFVELLQASGVELAADSSGNRYVRAAPPESTSLNGLSGNE